jgi:predicted esterase
LEINPYHKVFVGGFSQGGVISLHYALETAESKIPAGVMSLSGYMLKSTVRKNYNKFPICLMHGEADDVIKEV